MPGFGSAAKSIFNDSRYGCQRRVLHFGLRSSICTSLSRLMFLLAVPGIALRILIAGLGLGIVTSCRADTFHYFFISFSVLALFFFRAHYPIV